MKKKTKERDRDRERQREREREREEIWNSSKHNMFQYDNQLSTVVNTVDAHISHVNMIINCPQC